MTVDAAQQRRLRSAGDEWEEREALLAEYRELLFQAAVRAGALGKVFDVAALRALREKEMTDDDE